MDRELEQLVVRWAQAVRDREMDFLERLLAPEFTLTTGRAGAEIRGREEWLAITRERYAVRSFEFEWIEPRRYGDAAVVRSRYRQLGSLEGRDRSQDYLMTDVFVREADDWRAVARHVSPLEPGA